MSNIMDFWRNEWKNVTDTSDLFGVSKMENTDDDDKKKVVRLLRN